ncbi:putative bifunctional diguanylate cyclase/phosphodiesterase [Cryptosporangium sp. NPDC048952]|uniref:putative bifunctional diguanylate cyclase/phosphodiesterase n=1 Tax=Cryptosporangium sp. NPDC048952 TaxID=3363961 RepID=UPI003712C75C
MTERPGRLTRVALLCVVLSVGYFPLTWDAPIGPPWVGWIAPGATIVVGLVASARLAIATPLGDASRRFWRVLSVAVGIIGIAGISQAADALSAPGGSTQIMSLRSAAGFLVGLVLILIALLLLPVGQMSRTAWVTFALDAGTVLAGGTLFTWYFALRTAVDFEKTTGSALPLIAIVVAGFLGVLVLLKISFAGVRQVDPGALQYLAVAALTGASTAGLTPLLATRPYLNSSFLAFPAAFLFLTIAVERQRRVALAALDSAVEEPRRRPARFRALYLLPYVAVALTDVLLLSSSEQLVKIGAVVLTALVGARQWLSFRENGRLLDQLLLSENQLSHQASHDGLTGLANRTLFVDRVDAAAGPDVAVALIDLDDFKLVNDRLGHGVGDTLLVSAAARITGATGPDDTVARLGGDEFAVLLHGPVGNRLDAVLEALAEPLRIEGDELRIRASVGLAEGWRGASSSELIRRADVAMYAAKARGDGSWARFVPALDTPAADQARLAAGLRDGLGRGDFRVLYQPIVALPSQRITGVEALVRWHDPERGVIPPDQFIPVAERSGLILPLGRWVLQEACRQAVRWPGVYVCVNVSPRQLDDPSFVADVADALASSGLPASSLTLEVTETAVFSGGPAVDALYLLREMGVRVALDDFGTGQSSLGLLLTCPVDVLKVDRSFVEGVTEPGDRAVIVEFLAQVARGLSLDTVAEGVETPEQVLRLQELGYRKAQGYLFSPPVPASELFLDPVLSYR